MNEGRVSRSLPLLVDDGKVGKERRDVPWTSGAPLYFWAPFGVSFHVGQLQLLQSFGGLVLSSLVLGEPIAWTMVASTGLVILCVVGAKRFT